MEAVKEVALCKSMMAKSLKLFREIKMEAYSMRTKEEGTEHMEEAGDSDVHSLEGNKVAELKAPKRVKPQGRPAMKRIKSRMEYVKMFNQKNKQVATLYGDENKEPVDRWNSFADPRCNSTVKTSFGRTIRCGRCKNPGHNRSSCKVRGV